MPHRRALRKPARSRRALALESLEPRAVPAALPLHAILPDTWVKGAAISPGGSVQFYGASADPSIPELEDLHGPIQWTVNREGQITEANEITVPLTVPGDDRPRGLDATSPDGAWLAGSVVIFDPYGHNVATLFRRAGAASAILTPPSAPQGSSTLILDVSNNGDAIFLLATGQEFTYHWWNHDYGASLLESLYQAEGNPSADASQLQPEAISADGRIIVGMSGGGSLPSRATQWIAGVPYPLAAAGDNPSSALSISDDGRIVGGYVANGDRQRPAVWIDGHLQLFVDAEGEPALGKVEQVVTGVGGNPSDWLAVGSSSGVLWLATSDGIVHPLPDYLAERYDLNLVGNQQIVQLMADNEALYLVTQEQAIVDEGGWYTCTECGIQRQSPGPPARIQMTTHLLVFPHNEESSELSRLDVSGDQLITPQDALLVINALNGQNAAGIHDASLPPGPDSARLDVDADGFLTAADALIIINHLNSDAEPADPQPAPPQSAEGESSSTSDSPDLFTLAADILFHDLATPRRTRTGLSF